jgi:hypothetical protein
MNLRIMLSERNEKIARLARIKAAIIKGVATDEQRTEWDAIPTANADARWGDVVIDRSVDALGVAGLVGIPEQITKRDGRAAVRFTIEFMSHTTVDRGGSVRTRRLEFILEEVAR